MWSRTGPCHALAALGLAFTLALPAAPAGAQSQPARKPSAAASGAAARPARGAAPAASAAAAPAAEAIARPGFSFQIGPQPAWVVPAEAPAPMPAESTPVFTRLIDEQLRVEGASMTEFTRVMRVIREASGLGSASQVEIEFDPSYQTLTLHRIDVLRQGQRLNKLDRRRVELLQREKQLEQRIYDGRVTASILLDDMRVGDEIDLAYTVAGSNPVFGGKFVHNTWMNSQRGPAGLVQVRLLAPASREIRVRKGPADATVQERTNGALRETVFQRRNVPLLQGEPGMPAAALLDQQLQFSEFADWAEVAAWGRRLFERAAPQARAEARADEIRGSRAARAEQVLEALRFVQQEVRYFGVEIGTSSHQPAAPDQVIEQRYGDCKDKVALLAALLRRLDVPVRPVLVSARLRGAVERLLPSPLAFDHVIARVEVDGQAFLLDPTRASQSGTLPARASVGMGRGLELAEGVQALSVLAAPFDAERLSVLDTLRVQRFVDAPVLESRISYRGDLGEAMREAVAAQGLQPVAEQLTASYVRAYPRIRRSAPPRVEPPGADNSFTLVQQFEVPAFWRFPEQRVLAGDVVLWGPVEWLMPPKAESRRYPLAFPFPGVYRHKLRIEFPEDVYQQSSSRRDEAGDRHFTLQTLSEGGRRFAEFSAEVRIGVEQVEPADWSGFTAKLAQALPKLATVSAVAAVPLDRADQLGAEIKALEEAMKRQQIKVATSTQVQSRFREKLLNAQIDGGRLSDPLKSQALVARGIVRDQIDRLDEARQDFEAAIALDPESAGALNGGATNAWLRGALDDAVALSGRVLARQPGDTEALNTRALAHYFAGRQEPARADWDAVLADRSALRRGYPLLWQALATRRGGQALAALEQKYPRDLWPGDWPRPLLDAVFETGTPDAALQAARGSKSPLEYQTEAHFYLGEKAAIEGDSRRAREHWRKVLDLGVVEFVEYAAARRRLQEMR